MISLLSFRKISRWVISVIAGVLLISGCMVQANRGDIYSRGEAKRATAVQFGVVESVRDVKLEGAHSGTGTISGVGLGAIAGSGLGQGSRGHGGGAMAGAAVGGLLGSAIEQAITQKDALAITVKLDSSNEVVAVVQEKTEEVLRSGDRVRIVRTEATRNAFGSIAPASVRVSH